jgi:hypothetical protein
MESQQAGIDATVRQSIQHGVAPGVRPPSGGTRATEASQPRIDLNRLTDEVCRRLEEKLIAERERRGR